MNYKIEKAKKGYNVIETTTNSVICNCKNYAKAKEKMKFFNLGGGFDSWTPAFILKSTTSSNPTRN